MRYYKDTAGGYIAAIGIGSGGTEITEAEYNAIIAAIADRPREAGYGYRLRDDLTWETYAVDVQDPLDAEIDGSELLGMLEGVL